MEGKEGKETLEEKDQHTPDIDMGASHTHLLPHLFLLLVPAQRKESLRSKVPRRSSPLIPYPLLSIFSHPYPHSSIITTIHNNKSIKRPPVQEGLSHSFTTCPHLLFISHIHHNNDNIYIYKLEYTVDRVASIISPCAALCCKFIVVYKSGQIWPA